MKKSILLLVIALSTLYSHTAFSQDIHFSQFYSMPVTLNPSLTGHIPGSYRVGLIYRNQWSSILSGGVYATPAAAFDMNFSQKNTRNSFGLGLSIANDRSGSGALQHSIFGLSGGYHLSLDKNSKNYLSLGVQTAWIDKRIDVSKIIFEDQYNPDGTVTNPTEEQIDGKNNAFDLRAGATFSSYPSSKFSYMLGAAYMHLLQPKETFLSDEENALPSRLVLHGQMTIALNNRFSLHPHALYMTQAKASQLNLGANLAYNTSQELGLWVGGGYRNEGAFMLRAGLGYKGFSAGFNYDNDISKLGSNGAYELALGYVGRVFRPVDPILPCIRFY